VTRRLVAAVVGVVFYSAGRTFTADVIDAWQLVLASVEDGPDVLRIVAALVQERGFVTAPEVRQAILTERARAARSTRWRRLDLPALEATGTDDRPRTRQEFLKQCRAKLEHCQGPLAGPLKKALDPAEPRPWAKPDETFFEPPSEPRPAPEAPSKGKT
jgi:hypothetical protein